jgi:predicted nucleotidyltransferase
LGSNLVLSEDEKTSITKSITTLSSRLSAYFGSNITSHFQFGSYTRGTILPRKADSNSDIDYMIVFNTSDGQKKPQTYLDRLKRFAEAKYSTSEIYQSSPTIVLSLNHIKFELVPAIYNYAYQIPSPSSSWMEWMSTDPLGANQALQDKNKAENYQIKPLVRLIKYWNSTQGHLFTSFSIEQYIVGKYFWSCTTLRDYFYAFWDDFSCADGCSQNTKDRVARAKKYAAQAKQYEADNMPASAETEIKKIVPSL